MSKKIKTPVPGDVPKVKRPIAGKLQDNPYWSFSFKYFNQAEYFGLDSITGSWTVSLLERLRDLCTQNKEEFFRDAVKKNEYRYHMIDWHARGVPVSRDFFNWLPRDILNNEEEFPFLQFHISKAVGRVVGFWNEDSTLFYILILDPLHNIQPSKYSSYKIRPTYVLDSEYSCLLLHLNRAKNANCSDKQCAVTEIVAQIPPPFANSNFFYFGIDDDYLADLREKLKTRSLKEIIELGILSTQPHTTSNLSNNDQKDKQHPGN